MKFLIGIMHTIENEFEQCIASIKAQSHKDFDCFVIENLPNKQAHDKLYQTFMNNAKKYDLFIKIDADMVLVRNTFFEEVIAKYNELPLEINDLEIAVFDFFTQRLIYGLHVYRSNVTWELNNKESIFVDKTQKQRIAFTDFTDLAPAAYHCPNPSDFQSFHFGLHKAVKFMQINREKFDLSSSCGHWAHILLTYKHYRKNRNNILLYALLGIYTALKNKFDNTFVNYNNEIVLSKYKKYKKMQLKAINRFVKVKTILHLFKLREYLSFEFNLFKTRSDYSISEFAKNLYIKRTAAILNKRINTQ